MKLTRSDLAMECATDDLSFGVRHHKIECEECCVQRVRICNEQAAERMGKPMGHYVTLECDELWTLSERECECVRRALCVELRDMAARMCEAHAPQLVLVAGLGNAEISPDALGPVTVAHLMTTRSTIAKGEELCGRTCATAALSTGVSARTGLETREILQGVIHTVRPDLVIVIDALAAREVARLGTTIQLSDTGICPGSGVSASREALTKETLGVPVMALGVPTVVDSITLVHDMLVRAGIEGSGKAKEALAALRPCFVTPHEIDLLVRAAALLLSTALEKAFGKDVLAT